MFLCSTTLTLLMQKISNDNIDCCTKGVEIVIKDGSKVVVFVHLVAYIGDNPGTLFGHHESERH